MRRWHVDGRTARSILLTKATLTWTRNRGSDYALWCTAIIGLRKAGTKVVAEGFAPGSLARTKIVFWRGCGHYAHAVCCAIEVQNGMVER